MIVVFWGGDTTCWPGIAIKTCLAAAAVGWYGRADVADRVFRSEEFIQRLGDDSGLRKLGMRNQVSRSGERG